MSLSALRADAAHWDFAGLLGHGVRAAARSAGPRAQFDVSDVLHEKPLEVLDSVVAKGTASRDGANVWRLGLAGLPHGCESPPWLPAGLCCTREVRAPAAMSLDGGRPLQIRKAHGAIAEQFEALKPGSKPVTISWQEPVCCVSLPHHDSPPSENHVTAVVMGPRMQVSVRRTASYSLELLEIEGGPDGAEEVAASLFQGIIAEIAAAKAEEAAEAERLEQLEAKKEHATAKKVFVFGTVMTLSSEKKRQQQDWDWESESFALWSVLQQFQRCVKVQPWRWRPLLIEVSRPEQVGLGDLTSIPGSPDARRSMKRAMRNPGTLPAGGVQLGASAKLSSLLATEHLTHDAATLCALLRGFDHDGSGEIDWPEFRACSHKLVSLLGTDGNWTEELARREFEALDRNGDGCIQEEEWYAFAGEVLSLVSTGDVQRILALLGHSPSASASRAVAMIPGDVEVGLCCKHHHSVVPLRLHSWGAQLAESLKVTGGFRCAEVDCPAVFEAARGQKCTKCVAVDSRASFAVTCLPCGQAFESGWWCTHCLITTSRPRDREGRPIRVLPAPIRATCRHCSQPATVNWPQGAEVEGLCGEHAADRLLEEAARCRAVGGREPPEGPSLALTVDLQCTAECEMDDEEDRAGFAHLLETELLEALGTVGNNPPDRSQLEVAQLDCSEEGNTRCTSVQLHLTRAFGKPSPYELFARLRALVVDLEGPMYQAHNEVLQTVVGLPALKDLVISDEAEHIEMMTRVSGVATEQRPRGGSASRATLVVRPQRVVLPKAIVLSMRCLQPPEGAATQLTVYALAFLAGARRTEPSFYEYEAFLDPKKAARLKEKKGEAGKDSKVAADNSKAKPKKGVTKSGSSKKLSKAKSAGRVPAESGCAVCLSRAPGSPGPEILVGEATIFGLKPDREYDVFVAVFDAAEVDDEIDGAYREPLASAWRVLSTGPESRSGTAFGASPTGVVQILTDEPKVRRQENLLDALGLAGAPCILDPASCKVSCSAVTKDAEKSKEAIEAHGICVELAQLEGGDDELNPAMVGGQPLGACVLMAEPSYTQGEAELEIVVSADVVEVPCTRHCFHGLEELAIGLDIHGHTTRARCSKRLADGTPRCPDCRWTHVERKHRVRVEVVVDIVQMAKNGHWASVEKRVSVSKTQDTRSAVAVMLAAHPPLPAADILRTFEAAIGRKQAQVDFPLRLDGATALHIAVEEGHFDAVRSLLNRKMDPSCASSTGETPLHACARPGAASTTTVQVAELLVSCARSTWRGKERFEADAAAAKQSLLDHQDANGRTAMHLAAAGDSQPLVMHLLKSKADARVADSRGRQALHAAAAAGSLHALTTLLTGQGVDVDSPTADGNGYTALHLACLGCHCEVVKMLLQKKADPRKMAKCKEQQDGHPLACLALGAARNLPFYPTPGIVEVAKELIDRGRPPKAVIAQAGATAADLVLWSAQDGSPSLPAAQSMLALLKAEGLDQAAALGQSLFASVCKATKELNDRRDNHRVEHAQTIGAAVTKLPRALELALQLGANPGVADPNSRDTALHQLLWYPSQHRILPNDQATGGAVASLISLLLKSKANPAAANKKGLKPSSLAKQLEQMGECYGKAWQRALGLSPQDANPSKLPQVTMSRVNRSSMASLPPVDGGFTTPKTKVARSRTSTPPEGAEDPIRLPALTPVSTKVAVGGPSRGRR